MDQMTPPPAGERLAGVAPPLQWAAILAVSIVFVAAFEVAALPAAFLIGPMLAGIAGGTNGTTVRVPAKAFAGAQAVIGCLIAHSIEPSIFATVWREWPLFLGVVVSTITASSLLGWLISYWRILPGTTAVWGSAPGAATPMVLMAGAFGADQRLVAFMQYLRVMMVSVAAALVAKLWVDTSGVEAPAVAWFPPLQPLEMSATIAVAAIGATVGKLCRLPSPYFLGTAVLGLALHLGFGLDFQLPEWLLGLSYALIGWTIGLNFTRPILRSAARALPQVICAILILMAFCGSLGWLIALLLDVDPLTAYLATSPGGMDSIAIIAAATDNIDISFVMALQLMRFLIVLLLGPSLARLVARAVRE
jgi:membrane AbrB-like protein